VFPSAAAAEGHYRSFAVRNTRQEVGQGLRLRILITYFYYISDFPLISLCIQILLADIMQSCNKDAFYEDYEATGYDGVCPQIKSSGVKSN
jgi:hypothetical protein